MFFCGSFDLIQCRKSFRWNGITCECRLLVFWRRCDLILQLEESNVFPSLHKPDDGFDAMKAWRRGQPMWSLAQKTVLLFSLTSPASAQTCSLRHASFYQSVLSSGPYCEVDISDGKLNDYLLNLMTNSPGLKMLAITYIMYKINCFVQRHLFLFLSRYTCRCVPPLAILLS